MQAVLTKQSKGADYIFHLASPFVAGAPEDPEAFFVKPAVDGTKNVLSSVLKSKDTIKRVVLTSSFAGMLDALMASSWEALCLHPFATV